MKILWPSNIISQSGYAITARLVIPRLLKAGHEVVGLHIGGGTNLTTQVDGVTVLPLMHDPLANDIVQAHFANSRAQACISLVDVWAFNPQVFSTFPWFPWTPVDHNPLPPAVANVLQAAKCPIAMSRFGKRQLRAAGFDPLYMPLAYDPVMWKPGDKSAARAKLGIPDELFYVSFVGVNDSNPSRKGIPELLAAWSMFSKQYPNARLRLHTSETGNPGTHGGVNIPLMLKTFGINSSTVSVVDQYRYRTGFPQSELVTLAQASDLLILPSRGEGFGLPLVEFQACGCPVATTDYASQAELCFGGWTIEGEIEWSSQSALVIKPGIASIADVLVAAYADRDNPIRRALAMQGAADYAIDTVFARYIKPTMVSIAEQVLSISATTLQTKAERQKIAMKELA